jgi:hypothetical protein
VEAEEGYKHKFRPFNRPWAVRFSSTEISNRSFDQRDQKANPSVIPHRLSHYAHPNFASAVQAGHELHKPEKVKRRHVKVIFRRCGSRNRSAN